jgi:transposase-like protein
MGRPLPIDEVAAEFGVSRRTIWNWVHDLGLTRYTFPGTRGRTFLDPDEVRRKLDAPIRKPPRRVG